jgi:hypothetical protein
VENLLGGDQSDLPLLPLMIDHARAVDHRAQAAHARRLDRLDGAADELGAAWRALRNVYGYGLDLSLGGAISSIIMATAQIERERGVLLQEAGL